MVRTRIVCVSDTHGYGPPDGAFKLPKGDVLIHAGDLSNQGTMSELRKTVEWMESADFEVKIVIAGNHDITLDSNFYTQYWQSFHNQKQESTDECRKLLLNSSIIYLDHESAIVRLSKPGGPRSVFKIFGSPYTPYCGKWAFGYSSEEAPGIWAQIPQDADIVLTHTPPSRHCDQNKLGFSLGCEYLRQALCRVRPRLAVCGHVHEGRGYDRVRWNVTAPSEEFKETGSTRGELPPPGSKKQCLVDLTGNLHPRLQNDGSLGPPMSPPALGNDASAEVESGTRKCGRNETCIVNAAIMATNWPHRGGKKFNAPLVVDVDLPVAE
ncbi:hypothetical protein AJ79_00889 [Helicocarpus griseus UAMH5409]|uniref:Calcineurin-like phosphoesterase domain-containing protein n=1 Tax=Helicocarpus griseus UAMH5409 TaxID=1447875 RepID=A0A2B7YA01_9EURO|nr:hypothetical protein AJ79_00889 [Helicocarpus griseus UAMH5409]